MRAVAGFTVRWHAPARSPAFKQPTAVYVSFPHSCTVIAPARPPLAPADILPQFSGTRARTKGSSLVTLQTVKAGRLVVHL